MITVDVNDKKFQQRIYAALSNAAIEAFEEMEKQRKEAFRRKFVKQFVKERIAALITDYADGLNNPPTKEEINDIATDFVNSLVDKLGEDFKEFEPKPFVSS